MRYIEEVDLDGLVHGVVQRGLLSAATEVAPADVFVIALPTPFAKDGQHSPDISYVLAAAGSVAKVLKAGDRVILECTSPVGIPASTSSARVPASAGAGRAGKAVYDTRGIWPDQPEASEPEEMRKAG